MTYAETILADNPSYYWRLNESSGTTAVDSKGGLNGTISGGVTLNQPGALVDGDKCMVFDGVSGKIVTGNGSVPSVWTLEAWINVPTDGTDRPIFSIQPISGDGIYFKIFNSIGFGRLGLSVNHSGGGSSAVYSGAVISANQWHHCILRFSNNSIVEFYVNGIQQVSDILTKALVNTQGQFEIGVAVAWPQFFTGKIDEVAIYPYALTPAQISQHYKAVKEGIISPVVQSIPIGPSSPILQNVVYALPGIGVQLHSGVILETAFSIQGPWTALSSTIAEVGAPFIRCVTGSTTVVIHKSQTRKGRRG